MLIYLLRSMRIHHWIKNTFLFASLVFAKQIFNPIQLIKIFIAFILFSLISSCGYLINDLVDLDEDKKHPVKRNRPLASGKLPKNIAIFSAASLALTTIPISFFLNTTFGFIILSYFTLELIYSFFLKHQVILDVFGIALGFIFRVLAGSAIIGVEVSYWLLLCTGLISLFLGFSKRRHELVLLGDEGYRHRKVLLEYSPYFLDQMISVVTPATLITYILYTINAETVAKFGTKNLILTVPFVLYGIFRYLYLVHQKEKGGNPTKLLLTDMPLMISVILWALVAVLIIY